MMKPDPDKPSGQDGARVRDKNPAGSFHDNPVIYHLMTDRFHNSQPGRPASYGRLSDATEIGAFHGGNFSGISAKIKAGWFTRLGVNGILMTAPYEQIHGWVAAANGEFRYEAYHGYWVLDYTLVDDNFGSADDLAELVATAHAAGIRIILDIVIGHAGYPDLLTMSEYLPEIVQAGWKAATPQQYDCYLNYDNPRLQDWWGVEWVRAKLPSYLGGGDDDLSRLVYDMPKFRTESDVPVSLPTFLKNKPGSKAVDLPDAAVRDYLVHWLTAWVRQYGIDGFRCDSAKHVELPVWQKLKAAATVALQQWQQGNLPASDEKSPFWMTGEVFGNGIEKNIYFEHGFDNLINFQFQEELKNIFQDRDMADAYDRSLALHRLDKLYFRYATVLCAPAAHNVLSYISSHDTELFDREKLIDGGTALLLAPGGVQIFYGDETGRHAGPFTPSDMAQATRSDMNWQAMDERVLHHWRRLGMFRSRHVAIARGVHNKLCDEPYIFSRQHQASGDSVVIVIGGEGEMKIDVGTCFAEGEVLRDAYSTQKITMTDGHVTLDMMNGLILLERS
ncbi:alpha-amylase family glycosyl hydrolase [Undibacterium sp. TJN19]|uniref:alpha-amylase family glycosyl hydrolase n=1 Tax=Undibacterium sp. TJN19 TaxID=3413055 RepID=UPI003BF3800A